MRGEWRLNRTATYWPPNSSSYSSISFPFSWAAQQGAWRPTLCWDMVPIPATSLQLFWTSCRRGYIIICRPPTSCERHNSHTDQPFDSQCCPLIYSTGCTCYLHRCISSFDSLAEVNKLQETDHSLFIKILSRIRRFLHSNFISISFHQLNSFRPIT